MIVIAENLQEAARQLLVTLNRLIRIGIDAKRDGARHITRPRQFLEQQFRTIRFEEQLALKIEPGR